MASCIPKAAPPSATLDAIRRAVAKNADAQVSPPGSAIALEHINQLEGQRRSVSATLRRLRCEQQILLDDMRREREISRLQARLVEARTRGHRLPLDCAVSPSRRGK